MVGFFTASRYAVRRVSADIPANCGFGSVCLILTYGPSIQRSTVIYRNPLKNSPQKSVCGSKSHRRPPWDTSPGDRPKSNIFWRFDSPNGETTWRGCATALGTRKSAEWPAFGYYFSGTPGNTFVVIIARRALAICQDAHYLKCTPHLMHEYLKLG